MGRLGGDWAIEKFMRSLSPVCGDGLFARFCVSPKIRFTDDQKAVWGCPYLVIYGYTEQLIRKSNGKGA
ncbi:hypothetical protein C0Q44_26080 [Paenibacillus sp. PCH8]|uniref:hypothetical protein n=1 Tax=Paenibacillus sp. PCH8 TaxID=2066524 RepID=UPI000CFA440D|nr:hypothetical protein [Paenibacillus sp. PCH8]PQP80703.1 hypothetical protein C0Q44_26080 [Paenibacillus sp. PCH8]